MSSTGVGFAVPEYTVRESNDEVYMVPVNVTGGTLPVDVVISVSALEGGTAGLQSVWSHELVIEGCFLISSRR